MSYDRSLPDRIVVGPYAYRILATAEAIAIPRGECDDLRIGNINFWHQVIAIAPDLGPDRLGQTLLHEVVHAIADAAGHECPEATVEALTPLLLDTLRRNPRLVRFLCAPAPTPFDGGDGE